MPLKLPPGTKITPWLPQMILTPPARAFERVGVYIYNRVISKTEIGLYHKFWNPKVHGPYAHYRWYGKLDTKLMDVKLGDLPAWFGRREKSFSAFYNEFKRVLMLVHFKWYGSVYGSPIRSITRFFLAFSFINWLFKFPRYFDFQKTYYHW